MVENGDLMALKGDIIRRYTERCEIALFAVKDSYNHSTHL